MTTHECSLGGMLNGDATEGGDGLVCVHGFVLRAGDQIRDERGNVATVGQFTRTDRSWHPPTAATDDQGVAWFVPTWR